MSKMTLRHSSLTAEITMLTSASYLLMQDNGAL